MKGVVYYDNFNCIVNRSPDISDSIYRMRLDGINTFGRCGDCGLNYRVDCKSDTQEEG